MRFTIRSDTSSRTWSLISQRCEFEEIGPDRVRVTRAKGAPKTGLLKTSVGYVDGYIGEGQISYAGPNALKRARLAIDIVRARLKLTGVA